MFLNDPNIESTELHESINNYGQREAVLVVKLAEHFRHLDHDTHSLPDYLKSLDQLARHGYMDFDRVETRC